MAKLRSQGLPEFGVRRYNLEIDYEQNDETIEIDNEVIASVRKSRFRFRSVSDLFRSYLSHVATGVGVVAAIGATVYFFKDRFSLEVTPVAASPVIYEVIVPEKSATTFKKWMETDEVRKGLSAFFDNFENFLINLLGVEFIREIGPEGMKQLKNIKVTAARLCDEKFVQKALQKALKSDEEPSQSLDTETMLDELANKTKLVHLEKTEDGSSTGHKTTTCQEEQPCTSMHTDQPILTKSKEDKASTPTNERVKNEFSEIDVFKSKTRAKMLMDQSKYQEAYNILQKLQKICGQGANREVEWLVAVCAARLGVTESKEMVENLEKLLCNELGAKLNDLQELFELHLQNKNLVESVTFGRLIATRLPAEQALDKIPEYIQQIATMKVPNKGGDISPILPMLDSMAAVLYTGESEQKKAKERWKAHANCQYQIAIFLEKNGHTDAVLEKTKFGKKAIAEAIGPRNCYKTVEYVQLELCEASAYKDKGDTKQAMDQLLNAEKHINKAKFPTSIETKILNDVDKLKGILRQK